MSCCSQSCSTAHGFPQSSFQGFKPHILLLSLGIHPLRWGRFSSRPNTHTHTHTHTLLKALVMCICGHIQNSEWILRRASPLKHVKSWLRGHSPGPLAPRALWEGSRCCCQHPEASIGLQVRCFHVKSTRSDEVKPEAPVACTGDVEDNITPLSSQETEDDAVKYSGICLAEKCLKVSWEGNGNPLQYSCLANPMDGGAWRAAVHGVA